MFAWVRGCVQTVSGARAGCLIVRLEKYFVFEFAEEAGIVLHPFCGFRQFCRGLSLVLN